MMNVQRTSSATSAGTMQAITHDRYGAVDVLDHREVPIPVLDDPDRVLVRVHTAAANPLDWHFMTGTPLVMRLMSGLRKPKDGRRGVDMAGVVVEVGSAVTRFAPGDEVFGGGPGSFAEFVACREHNLAHKPRAMTLPEAAALPVAGVTALQGLRDHAGLQPGQSVLINGAGGGVGNYAVQIAKHLGAHVTAVCGTHNVEIVRSLGADLVVDYHVDDVVDIASRERRRFDAILDNVGNRSLADCRRLLTDDGVLVMVSGPKTNRWFGPIGRMLRTKLRFLVGKQRGVSFTASETAEELETLGRLADAGELRSVIDRTYPLERTADAIAYMAEGHAEGKVLISVADRGVA